MTPRTALIPVTSLNILGWFSFLGGLITTDPTTGIVLLTTASTCFIGSIGIALRYI